MSTLTIDALKNMNGTQIFSQARQLAGFVIKSDAVIRGGERDDIIQMICEELVYFKYDPSQLRNGYGLERAVVGRVQGKLKSYYMTNSSAVYDDGDDCAIVESANADFTDDYDGEETEFDKALDDIPHLTVLDKIVLMHDVITDNPHCASSKTLAGALQCSARTVRNYRAAARAKVIAFAESRGISLAADFFEKVTEKKIVHEKKESNAEFQRRMLERSSSEPLSSNGLRMFGIR